MTRVKISAFILVMLIGLSTLSGTWINQKCSNMLSELSAANELFDKGDMESVKAAVQKLRGQWEQFRKKASVLLKYEKLEEIDRLCSRIGELAGKDDAELTAEFAELHDMLEMLKSGETPLLTSVF
ncbi:MAG: DUF4363 family protein [Ruminococcus sp.]|uniref:DUF4363 family protein n=1 Tax=Ruminococcus sp. TaxID=41978 RepID=UPI0025FC84DF|nr:DUF4363 family protein [Ruminococcus sp.]MCR5601061.1 DUF4363 family protein [Ruminococcus sp.]